MKKYAVVTTDQDRVYLPKVEVYATKKEGIEGVRKAFEREKEQFEEFGGFEFIEGDTFCEDTMAVITTYGGEVFYIDLVEAE